MSPCLHPSPAPSPVFLPSSLCSPPHALSALAPSSIFLRYFPLVMSHLLPSPDINAQENGSRIWALNFKYAFYLLGTEGVVNATGNGGETVCLWCAMKQISTIFYITFLPVMLFVFLSQTHWRRLVYFANLYCPSLLVFNLLPLAVWEVQLASVAKAVCRKININNYEIKIALKLLSQTSHLPYISIWNHHEMLKRLEKQFLLRLHVAEEKLSLQN